MIYLDYAANTPIDGRVLEAFSKALLSLIGNANALHPAGEEAKKILNKASQHIASLLSCQPQEIIYTSGASESINTAILGVAEAQQAKGRHLLSSYLEHPATLGAIGYLKEKGWEADFVRLLPNGQVDPKHLLSLLRPDTALVSLSWVDSEIGIIQDIPTLSQLLAPTPAFFHVDATQAMGKVPVSFLPGIDLLSFSPHKFYGLPGSGALLKKQGIPMEPLIHGEKRTASFRSGSPNPAFAIAMEKALALALDHQQEHFLNMSALNTQLRQGLTLFPRFTINTPLSGSPYILNGSFSGLNSTKMQAALAKKGVCVSTKSACCAPITPSKPVYAVTGSRKLALNPLRISLGPQSTEKEINDFLTIFEETYHELEKIRERGHSPS